MAKHETQQKQRKDGERAGAKVGKLRSQPTAGSPPPLASTGARATKSNVRDSRNSRSSNSGRKA